MWVWEVTFDVAAVGLSGRPSPLCAEPVARAKLLDMERVCGRLERVSATGSSRAGEKELSELFPIGPSWP